MSFVHNSACNINFGQPKITQVSRLSRTNGNAASKQRMWIVCIQTLMWITKCVKRFGPHVHVWNGQLFIIIGCICPTTQTSEVPIENCYFHDYIMFAWNRRHSLRVGRHFFIWLWKNIQRKQNMNLFIVQRLHNDLSIKPAIFWENLPATRA